MTNVDVIITLISLGSFYALYLIWHTDKDVRLKIRHTFEVLLAAANLAEGTVAATVGATHGIPFSTRIAMHTIIATLGAASGIYQAFQLSDVFQAVKEAIFYKKPYYHLQVVRQGFEAFAFTVLAIMAPMANWMMVAYAVGDFYIDTTAFTITYAGSMQPVTMMSGIAALMHLLVVIPLSFSYMDFSLFKPDMGVVGDKNIKLDDILSYFKKHSGIDPSKAKQKLESYGHKKSFKISEVMNLGRELFYHKNYIEKGVNPKSPTWKKAEKVFEENIPKILAIIE